MIQNNPMKTKRTMAALALLVTGMALASCATRSDPTFMNNAAAAMHGGMIASPAGDMMMSPGIRTPAVHPFFGTPVAR